MSLLFRFSVLCGALVLAAKAARPLETDQIIRLSDVFNAYLAQNLSYDCFRYSDHNQVAECDCLACVKTQPDFVKRMCNFREAQEALYSRGKKPATDPDNIWHKICDPKCTAPTQCCDPAKGVQVVDGCVSCLPTFKSGEHAGTHPSCFIAEQDQIKQRGSLNWKEKYSHYVDAMDRAKVSPKCISYGLVRSANPCDCEPCLQSEPSTRVLRMKLCEMGRIVRTKTELNRPDFWGNNDYFLNFCNFEKCPEMPRKCCPAQDDSESTKLNYPVDPKTGCPSCMPTSSLFGFGPGCNYRFRLLPPEIRDGIVNRLEQLSA